MTKDKALKQFNRFEGYTTIEIGHKKPASSWQGLSDDEIDIIMDGDICISYYEMLGYARAIEQALKEKNT